MSNRNGFEVPNHTQTPNLFFDESLRRITSLAELKVVLAVIRQTFGWHKYEDEISLSQLQAMTGLTRETVSTGVQRSIEHGYIRRRPYKNSFLYSLILVGESDQSENPTSQEIRPKTVGKSDQQMVGDSDPQKKDPKEKKETPHSRLMKFHADRVGTPILNAGKQAKWIKEILSAHSEQDAIACYEWCGTWGDAVDWALVGSKIGPWLAKRRNPKQSYDVWQDTVSLEELERRVRS